MACFYDLEEIMSLLRSMKYLQEVSKTKSIGKAAENLYISKSALSLSLKNLESEYGVPILNRSVQGVSLTQAGEMILADSILIFNILDNLKEKCQKYSGSNYSINFFMEQNFSNSIFPHILSELQEFKSNTYIASQSVFFEEIFDKVREDKDNVGLFLCKDFENLMSANESKHTDLIYKKIARFKICVATAKYSRHIAANVTELCIADLNNIPQIELLQNARSYNSWEKSEISQEHNYVMSTDNNNVYYQAIAKDFGIGQMLEIAIPFGLAERNYYDLSH